jgi:pimeloyl-ACP methyl ester carboxylesterase
VGYVGPTAVLYAMKYPAHVNRLVLIRPIQPDLDAKYPAHLMNSDATLMEVLTRLGQMRKGVQSPDPVERCRKFWEVLRAIYVADPAHADRIKWGRCDLPNERDSMEYWTEIILPSIQKLGLTPEQTAKVTAPVLIIRGLKDRSWPYGDWAGMLPDARLVPVDNVAHAPWIEAPEIVLGAMQTFLDGNWPEIVEKVGS